MLGFAETTYYSLLLKLFSSKEVTFNCNNRLRPMLPSVYQGRSSSVLKAVASDAAETRWTDSTRLQAISDSGDVADVVVIDSIDSEDLDSKGTKGGMYIFVYDTPDKYKKMVYNYSEYLIDEKLLTVCMSSACYTFVLNAVKAPNSSVTVEVRDVGIYWLRSLVPLFLTAFLGLIHFVCSRVAEHISKFDPAFADFNIASSSIMKFKDLQQVPMPQCSICFEEFIPEDDVRMLDCKHYYHPTCIDRWLIGHSKRCPCCRNNIEINEKV